MAYTPTTNFSNIDWEKYLQQHTGIMHEYNTGINTTTGQTAPWVTEAKKLGYTTPQQIGQYYYSTWGNKPGQEHILPTKTTTPTTPTTPTGGDPKVVPGVPDKNDPNQMNVVDYAGEIIKNPANFFTTDDPATKNVNESMLMTNRVEGINENAAGTNIAGNSVRYGMDTDKLAGTAAQGTATSAGPATTATATTAAQVDPRQAQGYNSQLTQGAVQQYGQSTAQQGTLSQGAIIDPNEVPQIDVAGMAAGTTPTGAALKQYASQNISNIIDTSTPAGKALAQQLGDGNYTDSKATLKGQLEILQSEFVDANGDPKIPTWAAATARNVGKIAAFKGMTGSAATAAMAQALMEASIPVAQSDASFFQTLTLQNLSNKQAATINRANVLAKMELSNMDSRMAAAVQNSKSFLEMDLANLSNRQQAEVLNTAHRVQSILEDAKSVNAERLFEAQSQNEMNKFYDELNSTINQFNTGQVNAMRQFNATATDEMKRFDTSQKNEMTKFNVTERNAQTKFNAEMENNREQFYKTMQYNIDLSNAKWRQTVTLTESEQKFEAAATDVKNMVGIGVEQLNQIWDRSDSLLDYLWKSSENDLDRRNRLTLSKMNADVEDKKGLGSIFGTIAGSVLGNDSFMKGLTDFLF